MKNQQKLKDWGLSGKERYYYLRFGKGAVNAPDGFMGVATVCLVPYQACDGTGYVRGISFCNPKDQFIKRKGRSIALGRAFQALELGDCAAHIPKNTPADILRRDLGMEWLADFNVGLTEYEKRLFA